MSLPPLNDYTHVGQHWPIFLHRSEVEAAVAEGRVARVYPDGAAHLAEPVAVTSRRLREQDATYTGIRVHGGEVELDHNRDLTPDRWRGSQWEIGIVDQMVREDPVLQAIRLALTLPLEGLDWTWEPADDTPEAWAHAELCRVAFEGLAGGLVGGWLAHADDYTWRGVSLGEPVYRFDKELVVEVEGRTLLRGATTLDRIVPILPWAIRRWERYPDGGWGVETWPSVGDGVVGDGAAPRSWAGARLAPEELIHLRYQPEGDNPEPMGALRPAYAAWQMRRTYAKLELTGFQRSAYGIPYVEVDPSAGARPADVDAVNELLSNLRAGLRSRFSLPRGYTLKFAEFPFKAEDLRAAMTAAGRDASRAAWASMIYTGEDNGTQALITGQQSFFVLLLDQQCRALIEAAVPVVRRLVAMNFGAEVRRFPRLTRGPWRLGDITGLIGGIEAAVRSGALTLTVDVERRVRDALSLAPMPEAVELAWEARLAPVGDEPEDDEPPPTPGPTGDGASEGETEEQEESAVAAAEQALRRGIMRLAGMDVPGARDRYFDRRSGDSLTCGPLGRPLRAAERCVRLSETATRTEAAREELAAVVALWRSRVAGPYAEAVAAAPNLIAAQKVTPPGIDRLTADLEAVLVRVYGAGRESVGAELERQHRDPSLRAEIAEGLARVGDGGALPSPDRLSEGCCPLHLAPRMPARPRGAPTDTPAPADSIRSVARTTAIAAAQRLIAAAVSELQSAGRGGAMPEAAVGADAVEAVLRALSVGADLTAGAGDANTIFGLGREQEGLATGVETWVYSNLLESTVCPECEARDGDVFASEDLPTYSTPASWCLGGDGCNCLCIAVLPE